MYWSAIASLEALPPGLPRARGVRLAHHRAIAFVISANLKRRHLTTGQRAMIAERLATMRQGERTDLAPFGATSESDAASMLDVSRRSVQRARGETNGNRKWLHGAIQSQPVRAREVRRAFQVADRGSLVVTARTRARGAT